jgi:hypothetical protein
MAKPKRRIFDETPQSWTDLQDCVGQVFSEMGCQVQVGATVRLARGTVDLDVLVRDTTTVPHSLYVCECKNWARRIPKSVVHSFRTVVSEIGANRGFLISRNGAQPGALEAAKFTNVVLMSWRHFEDIMFDRWLEGVTHQLDPLFSWAYELMDPEAEELWKLRECTAESFEEWHLICRRYPLLTVWNLSHSFPNVDLRFMPTLRLTDQGVLSGGTQVMVLDTYRKIVDSAPAICHSARKELCRFWGLGYEN